MTYVDDDNKEANEELQRALGRVIKSYEKCDDSLVFKFQDGAKLSLLTTPDCCNEFWIEDINGDLDDLIGSPLLQASERVSEDEKKENGKGSYQESSTWTFYHFATIKGSVIIRFCGTSNGYYSERMDVSFVTLEDTLNQQIKELEKKNSLFKERLIKSNDEIRRLETELQKNKNINKRLIEQYPDTKVIQETFRKLVEKYSDTKALQETLGSLIDLIEKQRVR